MSPTGTTGIRLAPGSTASYGPLYGGQGTAAEWVQANPVLPALWIGFESDTNKLKIGDGVSDWNTLSYWYPRDLGDISTGNYVEVESDGTLEFHGGATVWDDLRVEPTIKSTGSNDPTFTQWFTNGAGSIGLFLFNFTDVATANEKEVYFSVQLPHSWKGTTVYPHVHWIPNQAGAIQRPVWGLEYSWSDIGVAFGNSSIIYTNSLNPNDNDLVQYKHYISQSSYGIPPSASQDGISSIIICRLFRRSGDASDTFTGTCGLLYIDFHFEIDTIGSREALTK
jgi:hypothetical protein